MRDAAWRFAACSRAARSRAARNRAARIGAARNRAARIGAARLAAACIAIACCGVACGVMASVVPARAAEATPADTLRVESARLTMGALLQVTIFASDSVVARAALDAAFAEVDRLDSLLTDWRPTGDVAQINRVADSTWVNIAPDTRDVLDAALRWSRLSGGAFEPTIRPLVVAWGFRGGVSSRAPSAAELRAARARVGAQWVQRNANGAVHFARRGMQLDLGGIAKGFALDRAAAVLEAHGMHRALLDFAGQVLALDAPPGARGWPVLVADPRAADRVLATLCVTRASVATSSQAERSVRRGGRRIGHILDPRSGQPVRRTLSCTAIARRAIDADAMSTAGFVVGPRAAVALGPRGGCDVIALAPKGRVLRTAGVAAYLWPAAVPAGVRH